MGDRVIVLHVVESWGAGVRSATMQFASATPEIEHHLLRSSNRAEFADEGDGLFASVRELPTGLLRARSAVRSAVRSIRPDVIHAHSSYAGLFTRLAVRSTAHRRVVYSPHCFAFERRDLSPLKRALVRTLEGVLGRRNTDTLVACSPVEAHTARTLGIDRTVYVPNVARVPALAHFERRDPQRVVTIGRLGPQKDPEFFRRAVGLLTHNRPGLTAQWIGDGDPATREQLEKDGIEVTGWLDHFDAHCAVASGGVYLHTARWEGFPVAILEAIELGVPVIAREVPTLRGTLATPGILTAEQMAEAADRLMRGGKLARQLNLDQWRAMLEENTSTHQAAALRNVYRRRSKRPLLVNGKWLAAPQSGMQRYAGEVARRVIEADPAARVAVPKDAQLPEWLPAERTVRSRLRGVAFEQLDLPRLARGSMLLNLAGAAPLVVREQLVVMHDVTPARFPSTFSKRFVLWYGLMNRVVARRARHLATVSEFSRGELADVLGVDAGRFSVAPNGHEHALAAARSDDALDTELTWRTHDPYVVCIGNLTPSKNLAPVTAALAEAGVSVIVVGASGARRVYAEQTGLSVPGVWLAGRLTDPELAFVLARAKALVFPSLYEGFGLPLVEAQALSCPVIASDRASIPEVAGDGALYFDPEHTEEVVDLVLELDTDTRRYLIEQGHRNVLRYSWDDTAATILRLAGATPAARVRVPR